MQPFYPQTITNCGLHAFLRADYILHAKGDESQQSTFFLDYSKQPFTLETNPLKDPGKLKDMNLCKVRIVSECYPCRFDINYSIENIPVIKEKILLIFDEYIAKRSGSMSFYSVTTGLSR